MVNLAAAMALWAFSTAPVANTLMQGLESEFAFQQEVTADVIILLGGGIIQQVPDLTGTAAPSQQMMGRVVTAARLYQRLKLPIIVSGGARPGDDRVAEAPVVKRFLEDLGVPENMIIEEDRARDTAENARYSVAICKQYNFTQPIVLTSAYHLKRAQLTFTAVGMQATFFPAYFASARDTQFDWLDWLPRASALYTSSAALHEYFGLLYYRVVTQ